MPSNREFFSIRLDHFVTQPCCNVIGDDKGARLLILQSVFSVGVMQARLLILQSVFSVGVTQARLLILQSVFSVGVTQVRKKDLRDWCKNGGEDRERKCSHKPVKSVSRTMSTRETSSG